MVASSKNEVGAEKKAQASEQSEPWAYKIAPPHNRGLQIQLSCSGSCLVFGINIHKSQLRFCVPADGI